MIATILPSSPTFHAVAYNETKVAKGSATLLEMKNFGELETFGYNSPEELRQFLLEYSSRNDRIKQPQFHLAISCKGHEYTEEQLIEFAHHYLEEMGYGDPQQPLLIYGHRDTDNTHIHIVTSRVDPEGKKINDSNERRKSQKVLDKLLKTDMKKNAERDLKVAMQFDFRNVNQFSAIMEAMNYECFDKDGITYIKKGGMIQTELKTALITERAQRNIDSHRNDMAEHARWKSIFKKYRDTNTNKAGLERDLKKMFGMSLVFFGKKDSPYGYVAVDFNKKKIYEGGRILGIKELLDFRSPEQHLQEIEDFINNTFEQNPRITTKSLNKKLRGMGAYIRKNTIYFGDIKKAMADGHAAILERNNKIEWRNGFKVQSKEERDLLCRLTGYDYPDLISVYPAGNGKYYCMDYKELSEIFKITDINERLDAFKTAGFSLITDKDRTYAYRPQTQSLTDLSKAGFEEKAYLPMIHTQLSDAQKSGFTYGSRVPNEQSAPRESGGRNNTLRTGTRNDGSHYSNREWEVGKHGRDRDDMDQNNGVSY